MLFRDQTIPSTSLTLTVMFMLQWLDIIHPLQVLRQVLGKDSLLYNQAQNHCYRMRDTLLFVAMIRCNCKNGAFRTLNQLLRGVLFKSHQLLVLSNGGSQGFVIVKVFRIPGTPGNGNSTDSQSETATQVRPKAASGGCRSWSECYGARGSDHIVCHRISPPDFGDTFNFFF
ncbi:hypothetical protein RRG08_030918 [Elysia crispata]|uniref:Uncharacterized protein n=1 Tax=Elysia crispata TaxID=231223 RepID=A0AAE1DVD9_9GAST|nr:hypothetical protein RRG08_030918 [Elysia crispata]